MILKNKNKYIDLAQTIHWIILLLLILCLFGCKTAKDHIQKGINDYVNKRTDNDEI